MARVAKRRGIKRADGLLGDKRLGGGEALWSYLDVVGMSWFLEG